MQKSTRRLALAASAVLAITAAAGAAMAQMPPPPPPPPALPPLPPLPPMDAMMMGGHDMAMRHHGRPVDPEAHAKHLRDVLQLRPDQDAALKAYIEAIAPQKLAEAMKRESKNEDDAKPLTMPERLDRQAAHMTSMAERLQKRAAATRSFYAALSPSQQKAFNALGPRPDMMVKRLDIRHDARPRGEHGKERTVISKRKPS